MTINTIKGDTYVHIKNEELQRIKCMRSKIFSQVRFNLIKTLQLLYICAFLSEHNMHVRQLPNDYYF